MAWSIEFVAEADAELSDLRAFEQKRIVDEIETQLGQQPNQRTRNRKRLDEHVTANFDFVPPLWELRVGEYRVFYEVEDASRTVTIHAVRRKPASKTTHEVLNENDDR